jgi:hypothetical protein
MQNRLKHHHDANDRKHATIREYFHGLWDFFFELVAVASIFKVSKTIYYHSSRRVSMARQASYELLMIIVDCSTFVIPLALRASLTPHLQVENGCTGCIVEWQDIVITNMFAFFFIIPVVVILYSVEKYDIPDPLMYVADFKKR